MMKKELVLLENDPELDPWYLENIKEPYSSITNLKIVMDCGLLGSTFSHFVENGARKLLVYTTAQDLIQVGEYLKTAHECGLWDVTIILAVPDYDGDKIRYMNDIAKNLNIVLKIGVCDYEAG